jgi:hypothetical protein
MDQPHPEVRAKRASKAAQAGQRFACERYAVAGVRQLLTILTAVRQVNEAFLKY